MRIGFRIGPFYFSQRIGGRRRKRGAQSPAFHGTVVDGYGQEHHCEHRHRTLEAARKCAKTDPRLRSLAMIGRPDVASMTPEEYRQHSYDTDPLYRERVNREREEAERTLREWKRRRAPMSEALIGSQARLPDQGTIRS